MICAETLESRNATVCFELLDTALVLQSVDHVEQARIGGSSGRLALRKDL